MIGNLFKILKKDEAEITMLTLKLNDRYTGVHYTFFFLSYIQAVVNCIPKVYIFKVLLEKITR